MKKVIALLLVWTLMLCLSSCANTRQGSIPDLGDSYVTTQGTTLPKDSAPKAAYVPGVWKKTQYSSEWLDMSFSTYYFWISEESMETTRRYNEALLNNDPNSEFIEMEFGWSSSSNREGRPVMLTIKPITGQVKTIEEYADELEKELRDVYAKAYGYGFRVLESHKQHVSFLNEDYFQQYMLTSYNGKNTVSYVFSRIKDNYLIRLSITAEDWYMDIPEYLSHFSTFDETYSLPDSLASEESTKPSYDANQYKSAIVYIGPDKSGPFLKVGVGEGVLEKVGRDAQGNLWGRLYCDYDYGWILLEDVA